MSYNTIYTSTNDEALRGRVSSAIAQEVWNGSPPESSFTDNARQFPGSAMLTLIWPVCSASDVEAAYATALAADNENPGGDEAVVTDGMILTAVQASWPTEPAP